MPAPPTGTTTFVFTDIEGSTSLWEQFPNAMQAAIAQHDQIMRNAIEANGGYVFKTGGDAFYAAFANTFDALNAAIMAQRALFAEQWGETPIKARIAIQTGVAELRGGDYFGPPLNRAARLLAAAHGGQVLLTPPTLEAANDQLPTGSMWRDRGEFNLRGIIGPERVYQLVIQGLPADFPPLRALDGEDQVSSKGNKPSRSFLTAGLATIISIILLAASALSSGVSFTKISSLLLPFAPSADSTIIPPSVPIIANVITRTPVTQTPTQLSIAVLPPNTLLPSPTPSPKPLPPLPIGRDTPVPQPSASISLLNVEQMVVIANLKLDTPLIRTQWLNNGANLGLVAVSVPNYNNVQVYDVLSLRLTKSFAASQAHFAAVFSPDGGRLATDSFDRTVQIWRVADGAQFLSLNGHAGDIHSLAFTLGGERLASGSDDKDIRLWRLVDGAQLGTITAHNASVSALVLSPNGALFASGSPDNTVMLWRTPPPDQSLALLSAPDVVRLFRLNTLPDHTQQIHDLVFSSDSTMLASASRDRTARLWRVSDGSLIRQFGNAPENVFDSHTEDVRSVAISPDGAVLATGSNDNTVKIWNISNGKVLRTLTGYKSPIINLTFSPDGRFLASGSADGLVLLWGVLP